MRKRPFFIAASFLIMGLTACSNDESNGLSEQEIEKEKVDVPFVTDSVFGLTGQQQMLVPSLNTFSLNLFREMSTSGQSTVISPLSVAFVLGMINEGAEGETGREIMKALGMDDADAQTVNSLMAKFIAKAPQADESVKVEIANNVTVNRKFTLSAGYEESMRTYYDAPVFSLDFDSQEALTRINAWCNEQTDGLIPSIIDELDPKTVVCLLDAIYFKGQWTEPFSKDDTGAGVFFLDKRKTIDILTMHRTATASYCEQNGFTALRLPFGCGRYAMTILLPDATDGLKALTASLTAEKLKQLAFESRQVEMMIPVFATEADTDLQPLVKALGVNRVFDPRRSELTKIVSGETDPLFVTLMKQKTRLGIDEEGSEGAAVTIAEMMLTALPDENQQTAPISFIANHPFIYYISEVSTGTIFFIGQFCGQ